jgi:precorrin-6A synthase
MRTIFVIGIGAGDPDHLTLQAVKALGQVDVCFVMDKGNEKQDLVDLRLRMIAEYARRARVVEGRDPDRDRTASGYVAAVHDWRRRRADVAEQLIRDELGPDDCGAFLVWGDPALYDSTIAIIEDIRGRGSVEFEYTVVPGITSVAALTARHRVGLNRVGQPFTVTTGRRLAESLAAGAEVTDVVVMLDAHCTFRQITDPDIEIYWGAYVGTADEILIAGPVTQVGEQIATVRAQAQQRKGWIMDTYLLRRASPNG